MWARTRYALVAMLPRTRNRVLTLAVVAVAFIALGALGGLAACGSSSGGANSPRGPDCKVDVLPNPPGSDYVEVGELLLEAQAANPLEHHYKDPYALAAAIHDQICAAGGDTLVTERNAAGEIVRGNVYRRANIHDVIPPPGQPSKKTETCEPECRSGFTCEGGTCVQHTCVPACGADATCGADLLCHPGN